MAPKVPLVTFNNGLKVPILGLGTWNSKPGEVETAVKEAIKDGYRHIDCAKAYENEKEVGVGIKAKLDDGTVKREDLFITTKLWITSYKKDEVVPALKKQLKDLGLKYLDLYLMHWPCDLKSGENLFPVDKDGVPEIGHNYDSVDTWRGMEQCVREGLTKSIGISNFNKRQTERIVKNAEIQPATNQVEVHPYLSQKKLTKYCQSHGITITAYSPLGSPARPITFPNDPVLLEDPVVLKLAKKYKKDVGQILIRYQIENGLIVIPKSVNPARIKSNFDVFDFKLAKEDMEALEALNRNFRYITWPFIEKHDEYPFHSKDEY